MPGTRRRHRIAIIGAGKVGSTFADLLHRRGHRIRCVISGRIVPARRLATVVGAPVASTRVSRIPPDCELIVIAVPDDEIAEVALALSRHSDLLRSRPAFFHTSGALTHEVLDPLARNGAVTFSLHPIQTFPPGLSPARRGSLLRGITYGFEGSVRARVVAGRVVRDLGGKLVQIPKQAKILYHAACVFASNYPVAMLAVASQLARSAGLRGLEPLKPLIRTAIAAALEGSPTDALTGPVVRGSVGTVRAHLKALDASDPALATVYRAAGRIILKSARRQGRKDRTTVRELERLLRGRR